MWDLYLKIHEKQPMHYKARAELSIFHNKENKYIFAEILTNLTENFTSWK